MINNVKKKYLTLSLFGLLVFSCTSNKKIDVTNEIPNSIDSVFYSPNTKGAFHKSLDCQSINHSKKEYVIADSTEAVISGYKPCAFCYSIKNNNSIILKNSNNIQNNTKIYKSRKSNKRNTNTIPRDILNESLQSN